MKKLKYEKLDITIYKHTCKNGLRVYLAPNKNVKSFYATLNVKFGSNILEYKLDQEQIKIPVGTAHFLEHKVFEQEDGVTPFDYFSALGIDCNASTNNVKTNYLFGGSDHFKKSLNFLLDYVESPYFTDENVEKEKGIISQEILMYEDEPSQKLYNKSLFNTYSKHNVRYSIGGLVKDIKKINKEILMNTYNAFYQPNNMYLVITGNIDPEETIKIVDANQNKKKFTAHEVEVITKEEPYEVYKKYEEIIDNVEISKFAINIKMKVKDLKTKVKDYQKYLVFYLETMLGSTSLLKEKLIQKNLITSDISFDVFKADDYCSLLIVGETDNYEEVIKEIMKTLKQYKFDQKEFEINKKILKSSYVYMSDNIYSINSLIANQLIEYDEINEFVYLDVEKLNKIEYNLVVSEIDLNNYSVVVLKGKK